MCELFRQQYNRIGVQYSLNRVNSVSDKPCLRSVYDGFRLNTTPIIIGGPGPDPIEKKEVIDYQDLNTDANDNVSGDLIEDVEKEEKVAEDKEDEMEGKGILTTGKGLNLAGSVISKRNVPKKYLNTGDMLGSGLIGKVRGNVEKYGKNKYKRGDGIGLAGTGIGLAGTGVLTDNFKFRNDRKEKRMKGGAVQIPADNLRKMVMKKLKKGKV